MLASDILLPDSKEGAVMDERTPEQILANVADEAKAAFKAELDFFEWRADHEHHDFYEYMKRHLEWIEASEPFARSCNRIVVQFPRYRTRFEEIVLPIQRELRGILRSKLSQHDELYRPNQGQTDEAWAAYRSRSGRT
jgi:hypothetical protein